MYHRCIGYLVCTRLLTHRCSLPEDDGGPTRLNCNGFEIYRGSNRLKWPQNGLNTHSGHSKWSRVNTAQSVFGQLLTSLWSQSSTLLSVLGANKVSKWSKMILKNRLKTQVGATKVTQAVQGHFWKKGGNLGVGVRFSHFEG